jgi:hypothetical protein
MASKARSAAAGDLDAVLVGDEAVIRRDFVDPVAEAALVDLDDLVALHAEQMMMVGVGAKAEALLCSMMGERIDDACLAEARERAIDRGEADRRSTPFSKA